MGIKTENIKRTTKDNSVENEDPRKRDPEDDRIKG